VRRRPDITSRGNSWLHGIIESQRDRIVNHHTGSWLQVLTSDVASSYGLLCDVIICDEVTHWTKRDLFDSVVSTAAKRKNCLLLSICNAGCEDSWSYEVRGLGRCVGGVRHRSRDDVGRSCGR
jgi:hypothetical protein